MYLYFPHLLQRTAQSLGQLLRRHLAFRVSQTKQSIRRYLLAARCNLSRDHCRALCTCCCKQQIVCDQKLFVCCCSGGCRCGLLSRSCFGGLWLLLILRLKASRSSGGKCTQSYTLATADTSSRSCCHSCNAMSIQKAACQKTSARHFPQSATHVNLQLRCERAKAHGHKRTNAEESAGRIRY